MLCSAQTLALAPVPAASEHVHAYMCKYVDVCIFSRVQYVNCQKRSAVQINRDGFINVRASDARLKFEIGHQVKHRLIPFSSHLQTSSPMLHVRILGGAIT